MIEKPSSFQTRERGRSFDDFLVRSFTAADRPQVLRLHAAVAPSTVDCNCATNIDQIEENYFRQPEDHFWVAEAHGEIVGTVALRAHEGDVAHLHCLRAFNDQENRIQKGLVQVAASHAHHHGCLKLFVHAQAQVNIERATQFLHRLGFEFSRHRQVENQPVLEFYLNLYQRPELESHEAAPIVPLHGESFRPSA